MKKLYMTILLAILCKSSFAVTIDIGYEFAAVADSASLVGEFSTNGIDPNSAITDVSAATFIYQDPGATSATATVEITGFRTDTSTDVNIYAGTGIDLSIFFVDAAPHVFDLQLTSGSYVETISFSSLSHPDWTYTESCIDLSDDGVSCASGNEEDLPIFVMDIDLDNYYLLGTEPIDSILLDISGMSAAPSLIGAHHLTPVPLPLPILLFASGLGLLGIVARKNKSRA